MLPVRQQVQIPDLEPSNTEVPISYAIQVRGVDADGNYGQWSKELIFESLESIPTGLENIYQDLDNSIEGLKDIYIASDEVRRAVLMSRWEYERLETLEETVMYLVYDEE